jgi:hypothetical protein
MSDKLGGRLFQIGGAFLLLLAAVHAVSLFVPLAPANETETQLVNLMTNYKFNLMGSMRSMMDLLRGFSMAFSLQALIVGAITLAFSNERPALLKRMALLVTLWLIALLAISLTHFFPFPSAFLSVAFLLFATAYLKLPANPVV